MRKKPFLIIAGGVIDSFAPSFNIINHPIELIIMEPKIKTAKELKIKASEEENKVGRGSSYTFRSIDKTEKQKKARAKNKAGKKVRKINRK